MKTLRVELPELGLSSEGPLLLPGPERQLVASPPPGQAFGKGWPIHSAVTLGGPDVAWMQPHADDDHLQADRQLDFDFWSVLMYLSLEARNEETFKKACLEVDLVAADGGSPPTAFVMQPSNVDISGSTQQTAGVKATVKVLDVSGQVQHTHPTTDPRIRVYNMRQSNPRWEMMESQGNPLSPMDFLLIVKSRKGVGGSGAISFNAYIEVRQLLFIQHRTNWKGAPVTFSFTPARQAHAA